MTRQGRGCDLSSEKGIALVYLAVTLTALLLFAGLATDTGRAWVVKAQLSKAVDAAALGSARNLGGGDPKGEATRIFKANFPSGFGGSSAADPTAAAGFFAMATDNVTAKTVITITASADVPTTFMKLGNFDLVTVDALAQATRRMVDLSLVLDVSSSIGAQWTAVHDSAVAFLNSFDQLHDRISLLTFSDGAKVLDQMQSPGRGFDKAKLTADVPTTLPGGSTAMAEGLYRGWDELRSVATGSQSSLRIIVLFTDGVSNSVPSMWADGSGVAEGLRTYDFPQNAGDTFGQTWNSPHIAGMFDTQSGAGGGIDQPTAWNDRTVPVVGLPAYAQFLPAKSTHTHHRSAGIPTQFPLATNLLSVDGVAQDKARYLRDKDLVKGYPSEVWNINNAARNLVEIIADAARSDNGDFKVRIYAIGMGQLVPLLLGTRPETAASLLTRMANEHVATNVDYNAAQLEGKYFYAPTAADVGPAFQDVQNQIIRLTK